MEYEYRIRECRFGGYYVDKGLQHNGGEHIPGRAGYTMPAFIVYETRYFETLAGAFQYAKEKTEECAQD